MAPHTNGNGYNSARCRFFFAKKATHGRIRSGSKLA